MPCAEDSNRILVYVGQGCGAGGRDGGVLGSCVLEGVAIQEVGILFLGREEG